MQEGKVDERWQTAASQGEKVDEAEEQGQDLNNEKCRLRT